MQPEGTPAWRLPAGVSPGVWGCITSSELAITHQTAFEGSALLRRDAQFVADHCPSPCRVVDLGCGVGRSILPLARRGFRCLGVDLSLPMLTQLRARATQEELAVDCLCANIAALDCLASGIAERVLCLFSTLGMVSGGNHRLSVLVHAARLLTPDGLMLLHIHNRGHQAMSRFGRRWLLADLIRSLRGSQAAGDCEMPPHAGTAGWTIHLFWRSEILALARRAGLMPVEVLPVGISGSSSPTLLSGVLAYGYLLALKKCKPSA